MKNICNKSLLSFCILFVLVSVSCNTTEPYDDNNYHNKILFTSYRSGTYQLYMMKPDGTNIKQITDGQYWHSNGKWSPDAKYIVCQTSEKQTTLGIPIAVITPDGSYRKIIGRGSSMNWSPDSKEIVYSLKPRAELYDITSCIYLYSFVNDYTNELTDSLGIEDQTPNFSPDGSGIIFASNRDFEIRSLKSEIYIMKKDGSNVNRITNLNLKSTGNPVWSPYENTIFFNSWGMIYSINLNNNNVKKIYESEEYSLIPPRLSPDGNNILVIAGAKDGSGRSYLYQMSKNGENFHRLIDDSTVTSCDWSK